MSEAIAKREEASVEFVPFGATAAVRLTAAMVRQFIAVPTKSGKLPTERDCIKFIMLCRGKRANPFEGDCFLIGYDAQTGPSFSMVCGIDLFQKRAQSDEHYDGCESGIIVQSQDGTVTERNGSALWKGEKLLGGWAKVYRKDRRIPEYKTVNLETYSTGRSRWEKDPAGMIEKVARSQALRTAYPTALGGLYSQEEMEKLTEAGNGQFTDKAPVAMPTALPEASIPTQQEAATPETTTGSAVSTDETTTRVCGEINKVFFKESKPDAKKQWKRWGIEVEGTTYGTFDEQQGALAEECHRTGSPVEITAKKDGDYWNIVSIREVSDAAEPEDDTDSPKDQDELPL